MSGRAILLLFDEINSNDIPSDDGFWIDQLGSYVADETDTPIIIFVE